MSSCKTDSLALFGGPKAIPNPPRRYNPIGRDELAAATRVIESGVLSQFLGSWDPAFFGGPNVQALERRCEEYFGVAHAVTVNSLTSGLIAAVGAVGLEPGDEVIVSPWTMAASATAIVHWNAIPVFADIEPETFCLDPASVEANVTPYTRAIMAVDIFGQSADMESITAIARKHGLAVLSDTAQAPGALYHGAYAGTLADVGGYSLNYHKHIHTGEGGILVTNDDGIADRLRLIRNHAEAVVGDKGVADLRNMLGFNFRLGEIESAIGIEQLKKLKCLVADRQRIAERLTSALGDLPGLRVPVVRAECTHVYYVYPLVLDSDIIRAPRTRIVQALEAEGVTALMNGYANLHLLPMYQRKIAYGAHGFPWTSDICRREVDYRKGICPVAETLHDGTYLGLELCMGDFTDEDIDGIVLAFCKVWANLDVLEHDA